MASILNFALVLICIQLCKTDRVISNQVVTNFGVWGKWADCESGEYVMGFQLMAERYNVADNDKTGMNGINLFCTSGKTITSSIGMSGNWGIAQFCKDHTLAVGFQLRSAEYVYEKDDTGATNWRTFCGNGAMVEGT